MLISDNFLATGEPEVATVIKFPDLLNSFGTRTGFLNDALCDEYDPTQWVSFSRDVILHFLKNRVSTTKCLFSCLKHKNI